MRVAVIGVAQWTGTAAELLRRAGLSVEVVRMTGLVRWAWGTARREFDAIHHVGGLYSWRVSLALRMLGKPTVWHWLGSDVLGYRDTNRHGWRGWVNRWAGRSARMVHLADSPQLQAELTDLGILSHVVRLLPQQIEAQVLDLPARFAALSYWSDSRYRFYRGDWVMELARRFPEVPFRIVGAEGTEVDAPPNVRFLGFVQDIEPVYRESTVFLRLPEHDSLSAMVLEMLARGRYVIYNQPLEHCHLVSTCEEAAAAMAEIRRYAEPNRAGADMVRRRFSLDHEAAVLKSVYAELCG